MGLVVFFAYIIHLFLWFVLLDNILFITKILRKKRSNPPSFPLLSVLIPARNEEKNIKPLLETVVSQDYPNLEVIVYDDDSKDNTYEIAKSFESLHPEKVKVIRGKGPEKGWTGKNYACFQLANFSKGNLLLFLDCDVRLVGKDALSQVVRIFLDLKADLLSLLPGLTLKSLGEKFAVPIMGMTLLSFVRLRDLFNPKNTLHICGALGTFMLFRRETYFETGGHSKFPDEIVEDVRLACFFKKLKKRVLILKGSQWITVRFYESLTETFFGFSKSAYGAFGYSFAFLILATFLYFVSMILPILFATNPKWLPLTISIFLLRFTADRFMGYPSWIFIFHPFTLLFGLITAWYSFWLYRVKKKINWKERIYKAV